jgi:hypothetical protein
MTDILEQLLSYLIRLPGFFTPSWFQLLGLVGLLVISTVMLVLGALVGGSRRLAEADLVIGWAVVSGVFVIVGVAAPLPFGILGYTLIAIAIPAGAVVYFRFGRVVETDAIRILVLSIPLLVLVTAMVASQWDEFSQWLPNARYMWEIDVFPRTGHAETNSAAPGDPYALATVIYMTSLIARSFVENAGAVFNLVLLLCLALIVARMIRSAIGAPSPDAHVKLGLWAPMTGAHGWAYCAIGGLAVTVLNPTFVPKIVFSAYADSATSTVFAVSIVLGWLMLEALGEDDAPRARALAIQLGLAASVLVNVKSGNLALLAFAIVGILIVAARDPMLKVSDVVRLSHWILVPPLLIHGLWQVHLWLHIPGGGVGLRPVAEWNPSLIPDIVARMGLIAAKKGGYFGVMLVALWFGARALHRRPADAFDRLAIMTAIAFVLFQGFLLFAYVAASGESDAPRAASYWRHNTQLGGIAVAFAAYGVALLWRRHLTLRLRRNLNWVPIALILAVPVALSYKVRFDVRPQKQYVRSVGAELARILPPDARVAILDPTDNGFYETMIRYELHRGAKIAVRVSAYTNVTTDSLSRTLNSRRASHVWVHVPTPLVEVALEQPLAKGSSYLLSRDGAAWKIDKSWPYPGYDDPSALPD